MPRFLAVGLVGALIGICLPADAKEATDKKNAREALQALNDFIGGGHPTDIAGKRLLISESVH